MMKRLLVFLILAFTSALLFGQSAYRINVERERLKTWPDSLFNPAITELLLAKNKLSKIPCNLAQLQELKVLDLTKNNIDSLPQCMQKLQNLEVLRLGMNNLTEIPSWIAELKNLKVLDIWGNLIITLPEELTYLRQLEVLDLRLNHISSEQQRYFSENLPNTKIHFSSSCNCY